MRGGPARHPNALNTLTRSDAEPLPAMPRLELIESRRTLRLPSPSEPGKIETLRGIFMERQFAPVLQNQSRRPICRWFDRLAQQALFLRVDRVDKVASVENQHLKGRIETSLLKNVD